MLSLTDSNAIACALAASVAPRLHALLLLRQEQLGGEIAGRARFLVMEPGDTLKTMEVALGFSVCSDPEQGLLPEWVFDHAHALEAVWILTDDGFAHVAWVPRAEGMNHKLIDFCAALASQPV